MTGRLKSKHAVMPRTVDGRATLDRYVASDRMPHGADARLYLQYLGVLTLLGRVAQHLPRGHAERDGIERAYVDANVLLLQKGSTVYYEHASSGGYAAFERPTEPGLGRNVAPSK